MGKVCVSHDTLLITDDDSTTQDDKSLPPCMQLRDGVGFYHLFVVSLSSSASVCTYDNVDNPPPRLQLRDGVGFYHLFFQVNKRQRRRRAMAHVGSLSSS